MVSKVSIAFNIEELRRISKKGLIDYMKKTIVETIKKEIDKEKIKIHIDIDEHRLKAEYILFILLLN